MVIEKVAEHGGGAVCERDIVFHGGSVVVSDFHCGGVVSFPTEDDAPLIVEADGLESAEVSAQGFQTVSWRIAEVVE